MAQFSRDKYYEARFESLNQQVPECRVGASKAALNLVWLCDALERRCHGTFNKFGLTLASFNVLTILPQNGPVPLKELSALLVRTPANITGVMDGLVRRALVRRIPHPEDRRVKLAELLPEGKKMVEQIRPLHHSDIKEVFEVLENEEIDVLIKLSRRVLSRMRELDE